MRKESGVARSSWQVQWACGTVSLENSHTNHKAMGYFFLKTIYLNNLECSVYCCRRVFCSPEYWINNAGKLHSQRWHVEQLKIRPSERSKQRGFISSLTSSCCAKPRSSVHLFIRRANGGIKSFAFAYGMACRREGMMKKRSWLTWRWLLTWDMVSSLAPMNWRMSFGVASAIHTTKAAIS